MIDERAITRMTQQIAAAYVDTSAIQHRFVAEPRLKTTGTGYMKSLGAEEFAGQDDKAMLAPKKWLEPIPWDVVEFINQSACTRAQAQFGHTSDGYAEAKQLWEQGMTREMSLEEALDNGAGPPANHDAAHGVSRRGTNRVGKPSCGG